MRFCDEKSLLIIQLNVDLRANNDISGSAWDVIAISRYESIWSKRWVCRLRLTDRDDRGNTTTFRLSCISFRELCCAIEDKKHHLAAHSAVQFALVETQFEGNIRPITCDLLQSFSCNFLPWFFVIYCCYWNSNGFPYLLQVDFFSFSIFRFFRFSFVSRFSLLVAVFFLYFRSFSEHSRF